MKIHQFSHAWPLIVNLIKMLEIAMFNNVIMIKLPRELHKSTIREKINNSFYKNQYPR